MTAVIYPAGLFEKLQDDLNWESKDSLFGKCLLRWRRYTQRLADDYHNESTSWKEWSFMADHGRYIP